METDERWLVGWKSIGAYLGRSAKTAQRWARDGMPFFRDPSSRPIAKPSMIDQFLVNLNREHYDDQTWQDEGVEAALGYENQKDRERKDLNERFIDAQRPTRSRF